MINTQVLLCAKLLLAVTIPETSPTLLAKRAVDVQKLAFTSNSIYGILLACFAIISGYAFVTYGYAKFKILSVLSAGYIGSLIGMLIMNAFSIGNIIDFGGTLNLVTFIVIIVLGIIASSIAYFFPKLGYFGVPAVGGLTIGTMLIQFSGIDSSITNGSSRLGFLLGLSLVAGFLGTGIGFGMSDSAISICYILMTSIAGPFIIFCGVDYFTEFGQSFFLYNAIYQSHPTNFTAPLFGMVAGYFVIVIIAISLHFYQFKYGDPEPDEY